MSDASNTDVQEANFIRFAPNASVWIADDEDCWIEVNVVSQDGPLVKIKTLGKTPVTKVVNASECFAKEDEGKGVDDMVRMSYLHEPGVLQNLLRRYQLNQIYTYTGSILIAVNPFARIPSLYDPTMKSLYQGARLGELAPHVFAIADTAYRAMIQEKRSQSVLISGESGAGKTETTKLVMEYLAGVGGRSSTERTNVESQVLESNPILEAFGNAKTVRNNNSSRFGKFIEIQFDSKGRVSGAAIKSYLLERSRVVQIKDPERNYHCFYQLCYGASQEEVQMYHLPPPPSGAKKFHYLNQSNCFELSGKETNADEYRNTRRAMDVLGFTTHEQTSVFAIIAAILHLGNVSFLQKGVGDPLQIQPGESKFHLECVSTLLKVDIAALEESLCTITRKVAGETLKSPLDAKAAAAKRDSLAKNLYSTLFDWIVAKVNESIGVDESADVFIGVLDIYGFEHFEINSFEQFCINLANEKLQQHFNQHVLKLEQEEYEMEQINWSRIPFADNQDVLDIIEKEQGILSQLDSSCKLASTTVESFTRALYNLFDKHPRFSRSNFSKTDFTLEHYAGKVKYSTNEFMSKNIDAVVPEHHELLANSQNQFIAGLFPEDKVSVKQNKFVSLGSSFKAQLGELMKTLNRTEPHYIRCVKPNSKLKPHIFEKSLVMSQLRSGGVLEAVRMCSAGYPTRSLFEDFLARFGMLAPLEIDPFEDNLVNVTKLMKKTGLQDYQIGLSKVFLRAGQMVLLETMRLEMMNKAARTIQRNMRKYLFLQHRLRAVLLLQTAFRAYITIQQAMALKQSRAAIAIQKNVRCFLRRRHFLILKQSAIVLQSHIRAQIAVNSFLNAREQHAAITIQRIWRGYKVRNPLRQLRRFVRGRVARKKLKQLKQEAALREDLTHQAKEANSRASLAKSQVLVGSFRLKAIQILKDKGDKARKEALVQLASANGEIGALKRTLHEKEEEIKLLYQSLEDAKRQAMAANEASLHRPVTVTAAPGLQEGAPPVPLPPKAPEPIPSAMPVVSEHQPTLVPPKPRSLVAVSERLGGVASLASPLGSSRKPPQSRTPLGRSLTVRNISMGQQPPLATLAPPSGGLPAADAEMLDEVRRSAQQAVEVSKKLTEENSRLTVVNSNVEAKLQDALQEIESLRTQKEGVEKQLLVREKEILEMESKVGIMQEKLLGKEQQERELSMLSSRIMALTAETKSRCPPENQQEALLNEIREGNLGYSPKGHPVAASIVFKALMHWKTFEAERTNTFDKVIETFQTAEKSCPKNALPYWLTNMIWLLYLVKVEYKPPLKDRKHQGGFLFIRWNEHHSEPQETEDTLLFKFQLNTTVLRLYCTIRDSIKEELLFFLSGNAAADMQFPHNATRSLPQSQTSVQRNTTKYWTDILVVLRQTFNSLQAHYVPPGIVHALFTQLLGFINVKIFNSLMVRSQWCPCTYSNGELIEVGLQKVLHWVEEDVQVWLAESLGENVPKVALQLSHVRQVANFLVCSHKPQKTIEDLKIQCPDLNVSQLGHICLWYTDDKYYSRGVEQSVIENLRAMGEESPLLLTDDERVPFSPDDILRTLPRFEFNEIEPPFHLLHDNRFSFLLTEDRRAADQREGQAAISDGALVEHL